MLLTTTTIKRNELKVSESTKQNVKKAVHIAKEVGEIVLLLMGFVDREKYSDLITPRCHER